MNVPTAKSPSLDADMSLSQQRPEAALSDRMTLRLDELAASLGVSRRSIERERSAGRFPKPDLTIGRMPLWRPETIRRWMAGGGRA